MADPKKDHLEETAAEEQPGQGETTEEAARQRIDEDAQD